jgi:hypothetical protein
MTRRRSSLLTILVAFAAACLLALWGCGPRRGDSGAVPAAYPAAKRGETRLEPGDKQLERILSGHVRFLASDALGGREVGTEGIAEAERYIAGIFDSLGLDPLPGRKDYFLEFTLYRGGYDPESTSLEISADGTTLKARPGVDFRPFDFSATGTLQGRLIFAGYGITAPEYGYDDYRGLATEGKIVLLLRHEPQSPAGSDYFQGADLTRHSLFLTKVENAIAHGAAGMLLVTDPKSSTGAEDFRLEGPLSLEPGALSRYRADRQPIPALHISQPFAEKILATAGVSLVQLQGRLDRGTVPSQLELRGLDTGESTTVTLRVAVERNPEEVSARNTAAILPGSDPVLRDQWILIGAHHDHLGSFQGRGDTVFNGADDNASGTAGVLALARIFSQLDPAPSRSIVFTTFSAEEWGLLGSREMVVSQIRTDRIVLMINLDMIGRNPEQPVQVMSSASSPELRDLVKAANREEQLPLRFPSGSEAALSDFAPFREAGIPFLFFFTGIHEDYHGVDDEAERLSYSRLAELVKLAGDTALLAAEAAPAPGSTVYLDWAGMTVEAGSGGELTAERPEARLRSVEHGSLAQQAGLEKGDGLLRAAGRVPGGAQELRRIFQGVDPGLSLPLTVQRGGEQFDLFLRRPHAGYLGVRIADVDEQRRLGNDLEAKNGVLIRELLGDGPAREAGLEEGDVLVAVDGVPVGPMNLRVLLTDIGAGARVRLTVLREGQRLSLPVTLGRRP